MLQNIFADLYAAQGFGKVFVALGLVGLITSLIGLALRFTRPRIARWAAVVAICVGTIACALGVAGFSLVRMRSTDATSATDSLLTPSRLELNRREGDTEAQRVAELGCLTGIAPLVAAFFVLRTSGRRRIVAMWTVFVAGAAIVSWIVPPRGRQLDRRLWFMLDVQEEAAGDDMGLACLNLRGLDEVGRARDQASRGPYAPEAANMTPEQVINLISDGKSVLDRCVDHILWRYDELKPLLDDLDRFGWSTPARRELAERLFRDKHPPSDPVTEAPRRAPNVTLVSGRTVGEESDMRATALFEIIEPGVRDCYAQLLESQPEASVVLKLRVSIKGSRTVDVVVDGDGPERLRTCVHGHVATTGFHRLETEATTALLRVKLSP